MIYMIQGNKEKGTDSVNRNEMTGLGHMEFILISNKVKGIVFTNQLDSPSTIVPPDEETEIMAQAFN